MFGGPSAPSQTPPPPPPASLASPSIMQSGLAERRRLNAAAGANGMNPTGGSGVDPKSVSTTKTLLGS